MKQKYRLTTRRDPYDVVFVPAPLPLPRRMVMRRPSVVPIICSSSSSCSVILMGVLERGFERGRFKRNGEGLLLRSAKGEVTASPDDRLKRGEECLMSNSSIDAFAVAEALEISVVASLFSGMLSERCVRLAASSRGLENDGASLLPIILYCCIGFTSCARARGRRKK